MYWVSRPQSTVQKINSESFKDTDIETALPREELVLSEADCLNWVTEGLGQKKESFHFTFKKKKKLKILHT